jgi:hypothetical protein
LKNVDQAHLSLPDEMALIFSFPAFARRPDRVWVMQ